MGGCLKGGWLVGGWGCGGWLLEEWVVVWKESGCYERWYLLGGDGLFVEGEKLNVF